MSIERRLHTIRLRLRSLFQRNHVESELDEELAYHIDRQIQEGLNEGLSPQEARRRALLAMGGLELRKEDCRDMRRTHFIENVLHDIRYACRMMRRSPGFTAVAVMSLALGIGANTAVFTFINAVFLRTLPVPNPQELVQVTAEGKGQLSFPMYRDLRDKQQVLTGMSASAGDTPVRLTITGKDGSPVDLDNVPVNAVTWNYFDVLAVHPEIGRFFSPEEDRDADSAGTNGSVIVLSDDFWEKQFERNPEILNKTIKLGSISCRVIGIAPRGFHGDVLGRSPVAWVPLVPLFGADDLENRRGSFTQHVARLKPGVSSEQAQAALTLLFQQLVQAEGIVRQGAEPRIVMIPAGIGLDNGLRRTYTKPLWIIMAVVGFVLLIACANVANLLLSRAATRRSEIGIRLAIGCSRRRLIGQLLTESLVLSGLGAMAALAIAWWGSRALLQLVDSAGVIRLQLNPDPTVIAFMAAVTLLTGLGFGLYPALRSTRTNVGPSLKASTRRRHRLSRALTAFQVAVSLVLLVGAGLLVRSFRNLHEVDLGFRPENVFIFDMAYSPSHPDPATAIERQIRIVDDLGQRVRQLQGVESASVSGIILFGRSDIGAPVTIEGYTPAQGEQVTPRYNSVSAGYFETVGMTLLEGRTIEDRDSFSNAPPVAVINESMANKYFGGHAVGRTMAIGSGPRKGKPKEIIGVVRDSKYNSIREGTQPMFYAPFAQMPRAPRSIEIRSHQPLSVLAPAVRQIVSEVSRDVMIRRTLTLSEQVDQSLAAERLMMRLCSFFSGLALMLACIGLYGVVSYTVSQRTNEIGIRMALGASRVRVLWMIVSETFLVVMVGIAAGVAMSYGSTRLLATYLFELSPLDSSTIAIAMIVLAIASGIAAYLPARRASKVDPTIALRYE